MVRGTATASNKMHPMQTPMQIVLQDNFANPHAIAIRVKSE
jgi:hypothetical protein